MWRECIETNMAEVQTIVWLNKRNKCDWNAFYDLFFLIIFIKHLTLLSDKMQDELLVCINFSQLMSFLMIFLMYFSNYYWVHGIHAYKTRLKLTWEGALYENEHA